MTRSEKFYIPQYELEEMKKVINAIEIEQNQISISHERFLHRFVFNDGHAMELSLTNYNDSSDLGYDLVLFNSENQRKDHDWVSVRNRNHVYTGRWIAEDRGTGKQYLMTIEPRTNPVTIIY